MTFWIFLKNHTILSHNALFLFVFFAFIPSLFSFEVVLKSGEVIICDLQNQDEARIRIKYKDDFYLIPKSAIHSMDEKKSGQHVAYRYRTFTLKDGSNIRGIVAEEDSASYTLRTDLGFLTVEKSKISKMEKPDNKDVSLPYQYKDESSLARTKIGLSMSGMANGQPLSEINPVTLGGGWFIEPSLFKINARWLVGYKGEYLNSQGKKRFDFFNNYMYIQYNYKRSNLLNFYGNLGIGASYVRYFGNDNRSIAGTDPSVYFEFGWQGLQFDRLFFRFGIKSTYVHEAGNGLGMVGAEFSLGFNI